MANQRPSSDPRVLLGLLGLFAAAFIGVGAIALAKVMHTHGTSHQGPVLAVVLFTSFFVFVIGLAAIRVEHQVRYYDAARRRAPAMSPPPAMTPPAEPPTVPSGEAPGQWMPPMPAPTPMAMPFPPTGDILPGQVPSTTPWDHETVTFKDPVMAGRGTHGPISATALAVFLVGCLFVVALIDFTNHRAAAQSVRTQHHGIASTATVEAVQRVLTTVPDGNCDHSANAAWVNSCDNPANQTTEVSTLVTVLLPDGVTSVVHDPKNVAAADVRGQQVQVLTDPNNASYSEFPGEPNRTNSLLFELFAFLMVGSFAGVGIYYFVKTRRPPEATRSA